MSVSQLDASHLTHRRTRSKGDWASLIAMMPSAVALMSARGIASQSLELISNAVNNGGFLSVLAESQAHLRAAQVPVLIKEHRGAPLLIAPSDLTRSKRRWLGQLVLELYFAQLFRSDTAIVDLSPSRLGVQASGEAIWRPRPLYVRWDPHFLEPLRDVYAGFFHGNHDCMEGGFRQLRLGASVDPLTEHLGNGNQRSVRFNSAKLRSTLRGMSVHSRSADDVLHRNFVAFGLYVASLHELLESLDLAFDVRSAFMRSSASIG